jgi:hypothetical protein
MITAMDSAVFSRQANIAGFFLSHEFVEKDSSPGF